MNKPELFFFLALFFISCETVVDVDIPEKDPMIVVNAVLSENDTIEVNLSKSIFIKEHPGDIAFINEATLAFFENGNFITNLTNIDENGNYSVQGFYPEAGKSYRIEITSGEMTPVNATTTIPLPVPIINLDTLYQKKFDYGYEYLTLQFKLKFDDPPGEKNYYYLSTLATFVYEDEYEGYTESYQQPLYIDTDDPVLSSNMINYSGEFAFTDDHFDGNSYSVIFNTDAYMFYDTTEVAISLHSISKDLYYYFLSSFEQDRIGDDPFTELIHVNSNIENGLGIFGASSRSCTTIHVLPVAGQWDDFDID